MGRDTLSQQDHRSPQQPFPASVMMSVQLGNSEGPEADSHPRPPASPSNSSSSASTETVPPLQSDLPSEGQTAAEQGRPKRCKISREQLTILIKSFDEESLPNFDQRQGLAKMLGM